MPLNLEGTLNLMGTLDLDPGGGTVTVDGKDVVVLQTGTMQANAVAPVILPPPPAGPANTATTVDIMASFNVPITIKGVPIVAMGMVMQATMWPGMILPGPAQVTANGIPINVVGDKAVIFPNGGSASLDTSGQ